MEHYITRLVRLPVECPEPAAIEKVRQFRLGQGDRKLGEPCKSANGAYLDGWYSPEKTIPPYITESEMLAFKL